MPSCHKELNNKSWTKSNENFVLCGSTDWTFVAYFFVLCRSHSKISNKRIFKIDSTHIHCLGELGRFLNAFTVKVPNIAHLSILTSVGYNKKETNLNNCSQQ